MRPLLLCFATLVCGCFQFAELPDQAQPPPDLAPLDESAIDLPVPDLLAPPVDQAVPDLLASPPDLAALRDLATSDLALIDLAYAADLHGACPIFVVSPSPIDLACSRRITLHVADQCDMPQRLDKPSLAGPDVAAFQIDHGVLANLYPLIFNPGVGVDLDIVYVPQKIGPATASFEIKPFQMQPAQSIPIAAAGTGQTTFDTKNVIFGNQQVGVMSVAGVFTITNLGVCPLHIAGFLLGGANPGDYSVDLGGIPPAIPPNGTAKLKVYLTPKAQGMRSATINLQTDEGGVTPSLYVVGNGI